MMPLPIVGRELRVAARRPMTYFSRPLAVLGAGLLLMVITSRFGFFFQGPEAGKQAFISLVITAALYSFIEAIRTAADCLCREKREGTLGLLFLTKLSGFDVVAGKLAAAALNSLYGLLAMLPILTVTLSLGGIKWDDVFREAVALLNWIFYAYAVVMWSSARAKNAYHAVMTAVGWLLGFACGPLLVDFFFLILSEMSRGRMNGPMFSPLSPLFGVGAGFPDLYPYAKPAFVFSLIVTHGAAWIFLSFAARRIRRQWELAPEPMAQKSGPPRSFALSKPVLAACDWKRERLRERNPIIWLSRRKLGHAGGWFVVLGIIAFGFGAGRLFIGGEPIGISGFLFSIVTGIYPYLLFGVAAVNAGRLFAELSENGAWEWLVCARLSSQEIIAGQWRALTSMWIKLTLGCVLLMGANYCLMLASAQGNRWYFFKIYAIALFLLWVKMTALCWASMWFALRSKGLISAAAKSLIVIVVLPGLASWLYQQLNLHILGTMRMSSQGWPAYGVILFSLAYYLDWIYWSRKNMHIQLREIVSAQAG